MRKSTIVTLDGTFELDETGFYIPAEEPEQKASGLWLVAIGAGVLFPASVGLFYAAYRAFEAWLAV
ncbi:hypothetical protein LB579_34840 [Mesorhizobium sp. BR1-1-7]|uniref:hypothetical protein n=1 Tax=Mesorhizobium sp. BR1-1-7 TaxID=2876647 RepID=UPI001CCD84A0|nr:hypothetical protein [Mesorhizobium sp. BR1-1-7]MBZ9922832.1 hypothetical protein [Mesorhizobium sp. BR1-1-7]